MSTLLYEELGITQTATVEESKSYSCDKDLRVLITTNASPQSLQKACTTDSSRPSASEFYSRRQDIKGGAVPQGRLQHRLCVPSSRHQVNNAYEILIDEEKRRVSLALLTVLLSHKNRNTTFTVFGRLQSQNLRHSTLTKKTMCTVRVGDLAPTSLRMLSLATNIITTTTTSISQIHSLSSIAFLKERLLDSSALVVVGAQWIPFLQCGMAGMSRMTGAFLAQALE